MESVCIHSMMVARILARSSVATAFNGDAGVHGFWSLDVEKAFTRDGLVFVAGSLELAEMARSVRVIVVTSHLLYCGNSLQSSG